MISVCSTRVSQALGVMADNYASVIGTTVLRLEEIPLRPREYDGALCVFLLRDENKNFEPIDVTEETLRTSFGKYGSITRCEMTA